MADTTIEEIYEQHVRVLSAEQRLRLVALITEELADEATEAELPPPRGIKELYGAGRASWDGSDAQEYVNKLREEWDEPETGTTDVPHAGRRLTSAEVARGLQALEDLKALQEELMAERGGRLFDDSTELIRQAREERSRQSLEW